MIRFTSFRVLIRLPKTFDRVPAAKKLTPFFLCTIKSRWHLIWLLITMMASSNQTLSAWLSPVNSLHKCQWREVSIFSLICAWTNDWVTYRKTGDLRRHLSHYDVTVMAQLSQMPRTIRYDSTRTEELPPFNCLTVPMFMCQSLWAKHWPESDPDGSYIHGAQTNDHIWHNLLYLLRYWDHIKIPLILKNIPYDR